MGYHFAVWAASIQRTVVSLCCMYQILIHFSPWRFTCHGKLILWQLAYDSAVLDFLNLWKRKHMLKHRNVHSRHSVWVTDSFIAWKVNNNFNFYYTAESASGQDGANPAFWLATRAGKIGPARDFPRWSFEEKVLFSAIGHDGWILASVFVSVNKNAKTILADIQRSWHHAWSKT